jgi:hypothetical protein
MHASHPYQFYFLNKMTSETPRRNVDDTTQPAAFCWSIAIGLIMLFSGLIFRNSSNNGLKGLFIAGFCFVLAPFVFQILLLVYYAIRIGVANPKAGVIMLLAALCIVCICVECAFMLFPLPFSLAWSSLVTGLLGFGCKHWFYRTKASVVEVRAHSKLSVRYQHNDGRPAVQYEWIGDYQVPVSCKARHQTSLHEDRQKEYQENDTIFEIMHVRKKFLVSEGKFNETVREAYVLPRYPKHAILVNEDMGTSGKVLLVLFCSVFVVGFAFPGLGMPISSFTGSNDGLWVPCTDWKVIVSYSIIVGIACLVTLLAIFNDPLSREAVVLSSEQELPDLQEDSELQHSGDNGCTTMTLGEEGTESELDTIASNQSIAQIC